MNAFNTVNLAAACILTSVENAERVGIPQDKWIYVLGGAGTNEKENCEFPSSGAPRHILIVEPQYSLGKT